MINYTTDVKDVYNTTAKSGFPSPALDYLEESIDLNKELIQHPLSTFFMMYNRRDMIQAGVYPGSHLVIDRSLIPGENSLMMCAIDGQFYVRYLKKQGRKAWLHTGDAARQSMDISGRPDVLLWGVITHVIVNAQKALACMPS